MKRGGCNDSFRKDFSIRQDFIFPAEWWDQIVISEGAVLMLTERVGSNIKKSFRLRHDGTDRVALYFPEELGLRPTVFTRANENSVACNDCKDGDSGSSDFEVIKVDYCSSRPLLTDGLSDN